MARKTIALVGAYERDNFGDLLFALITKRFLTEYDVVFTSPLSGSADKILGQEVFNYRSIFSRPSAVDALWTVGGHVGGARPNSPASNYPGRPKESLDGIESPYLPRPSKYPQIANVPYVINSVSFGGVLRSDPTIRAYSRAAVSEADVVSVRDRSSSETLEAWGVPYLGSPDLVHTISEFMKRPAKTGEVVIQFSDSHFDDSGLEEFGRWIANEELINSKQICLLIAGTAPNHDSRELYERFIHIIHQNNEKVQVRITDTRDPFELAEIIAASSLWIGTSLHGRIIACTYGVPRLSWSKWKLSSYCSVWDQSMPYDVTIENISSRVAFAMGSPQDSSGRVNKNRANTNIDSLLARLEDSFQESGAGRLRRRLRSLERFNQEIQSL